MQQIVSDDILYKDDYICILKPNVKKGVLIVTRFYVDGPTNVCKQGLKTGQHLQKQGKTVRKHAGKALDKIFFKAPYLPLQIAQYPTIQQQLRASYGDRFLLQPKMAVLRVDPDQTFVFSSEIRTTGQYWDNPRIINASKKTLTKYYDILRKNNQQKIQNEKQSGKKIVYNMHSSQIKFVPLRYNMNYPFSEHDIASNSEILIQTPVLGPEHFVWCSD